MPNYRLAANGRSAEQDVPAFTVLDTAITLTIMDVDYILATMNDCQVEYLLIGGMNFLLRHEPVLTFDIDLWINDREANRRCCERALETLEAEWGETDADWGKVAERGPGWLNRQPVFCLNSPSGAIDIFRTVTGLPDWAACRVCASREMTASGTVYWGLSDEDMLRCQLALEAPYRKPQRIATLERVLRERDCGNNA